MGRNIGSDPRELEAAVLGAATAGAIAVSVESGAWTLGDTVIGVTLLVVLRAFGGRTSSERWRNGAFAVTWGLCTMLVIGVGLQFLGLTDDAGVAFLCAWAAVSAVTFSRRDQRRSGRYWWQ